MESFSIGDIEIGIGKEPLVIPEMGINHGGSLNIAKQIVDAAESSGAKVIKHQTHVVDDEMSQAAKQVVPGNANVSIYDVMKHCALNEKEEYELMQYVESKGMVYLSTPFSRAAANRLQEFGVKAFKIGSGELNNYPLLKHVASFGKPMIVSTGMNNIANIKRAVDIMQHANIPYALLHTTNLYPTDASLVRLGAMQEMMNEFPKVPIGLSDHTKNNYACIAALALGATIVERHFIDRKDRKGPDIICSMDEKECIELLAAARDVPKMLGGNKEPAKEEQVTIDFAFASVVTIKEIKRGETFTKDNIWVKRPGTGEIAAEQYENLLGKRAMKNIDNDTLVNWEMVER